MASQPRIWGNLGSSQLLFPEIAQISWEFNPSPFQKCAFPSNNRTTSCMYNWVDRFPLGPRKIDFPAWAASPKASCKCISCFRDLFLASGGYMK